jgi:hydroxymethylpyrimidine/phosphomethylpyrimidine kinase
VNEVGQPPVALTIAGSDSGAGAGIQADVRTMSALGVFATTALTAVTAQNTTAVRRVHPVPADMVVDQIRAVLDDLPVAAVKTGLLGEADVVGSVGALAASGALPRLVVDPVMVASTGRALVSDEGIEAYRRTLLPHALIVTPNLWEAGLLAGEPASYARDVDAMTTLARRLHGLGPGWVLVKGGHLPGVASPGVASPGVASPAEDGGPDGVADVLFDGTRVTVLVGPRVETSNTHGTGCSLSAAITAHLARGADVPSAVAAAKEFVHGALLGGAGWRLGNGHGPLDQLGWSQQART